MSRCRRLTRAGVPNKDSAEIKTQTEGVFCNWRKVILSLLHLSLMGSKKSIKRRKDVTERKKPIAFSFPVTNIIFPRMFSASHLMFPHKGDIRHPSILQCSQCSGGAW